MKEPHTFAAPEFVPKEPAVGEAPVLPPEPFDPPGKDVAPVRAAPTEPPPPPQPQ